MAKAAVGNIWRPSSSRRKKKHTSIGRSKNTHYKGKNKYKKKYRGQG